LKVIEDLPSCCQFAIVLPTVFLNYETLKRHEVSRGPSVAADRSVSMWRLSGPEASATASSSAAPYYCKQPRLAPSSECFIAPKTILFIILRSLAHYDRTTTLTSDLLFIWKSHQRTDSEIRQMCSFRFFCGQDITRH